MNCEMYTKGIDTCNCNLHGSLNQKNAQAINANMSDFTEHYR